MNDTPPATRTDAPPTPPTPLVPLVPLLQLPGLPAAGAAGDVPVCGPDGCAVPQRPEADGRSAPEQD